ncbi:MAG: DNA-3-methyladenine glycosylase 2 family protein [Candidatus Nanopelagicales bacterium]
MSSGRVTEDSAVREWTPGRAVDVAGTLAPLRRGRFDPTYQLSVDGSLWRTMLTPIGAATQRISVRASEGVVVGESWGDGAQWAADRLPASLGADDDVSGFDASLHPLVARQWHRHSAGLRTPAVGLVLEMLVAAVLEQRVTGNEARRSWRWLLTRHGDGAPGPAPEGMRVFPSVEACRRSPSWEWHRAGVEQARSATIMALMTVASRMAECVTMSGEAARARMQLVPGVGVWTAAEAAQRALGDADAVSYGDFHVAHNVVYALTGEIDGTDERLAELLAPSVGHRGRVVRLVELSRIRRPARGPRYAPIDFRQS